MSVQQPRRVTAALEAKLGEGGQVNDGFLSPLASEFLSPYFDMLDALGPGKMNRITHSEKLVALLAQVQSEARNEALKEAQLAFKGAYSDYDDPLIGVMWGLKAIAALEQAAASKAAGGERP